MSWIFEYLFFIIFAISICNTLELSEEFVQKNENFALDFYNNLISISEHKNKSIVFSPISIQICGGLLYAGADGITADQMFKGFKFVSKDSISVGKEFENILLKYIDNPFLKIINKIYVLDGNKINPNFTKFAFDSYKSEVENINFMKNIEAADKINKWVENKTGNLIKDFVEASVISSEMKMFLLNIIYFKAEWKTKFEQEHTRKVNFWITKDISIQVDMMFKIGNYKFGNFPELSAYGVEIPFKDNLSLFVLLPRNSDLLDVEKKIQKVNLNKIYNKLGTINMAISLPKFQILTSIDMTVILQYMDMWDMFGNNADFSKLFISGAQLEISKAVHKAIIKIDENGAEAVAATGLGISFRTGPFHLNLNQPFLYFIKGDKGEIYFMGRYTGV